MSRSALVAAVVAGLCAVLAAGAPARPVIEGQARCAGAAGRYLVELEDGRATILSAAEFPGGRPAVEASEFSSSPLPLWRSTIPGFAPLAAGCIAFDKDLFTWPGDLVTYVQYLIRELLMPAQQLDPELRTLTVRERTVRLEVERPGRDRALLSGPEGAMLGFGRHDDAERYFFLPVLLGGGETTLVRILSNKGQAFGERSTTPIGWVLLRGDAWAVADSGPGFRLRRLPEPIAD